MMLSQGLVLEVIWKVISTIINNRLTSNITFHSALHGFRRSSGTGSAIMEAKLQISHAERDGKILYQVFLDLTKAYDTIDRPRMLEILTAYSMGPNMLLILKNFWEDQKIAVKQRGFWASVFRWQGCDPRGHCISNCI